LLKKKERGPLGETISKHTFRDYGIHERKQKIVLKRWEQNPKRGLLFFLSFFESPADSPQSQHKKFVSNWTFMNQMRNKRSLSNYRRVATVYVFVDQTKCVRIWAMADCWTGSIFVFSNQNLLILTTTLFGLFVISEVIGGLISNSLSLLGDATAMSVDVLTYCGNIYAEYLKGVSGKIDQRTIIVTEIVIPIVSLVSLVGVSIWVSYDASLRLRGHKHEDVKLSFMIIFPIANFVIDFYCALLFYLRRHDIFRQSPSSFDLQMFTSDEDFSIDFSDSSSDSSGREIQLSDFHHSASERKNLVSSSSKSSSSSVDPGEGSGGDQGANVNMMSAFTHISGDTLRTVATIIAAGISYYFHYDPGLCDAWAAIIVSATIIFSALPLVYSISHTISALSNSDSLPPPLPQHVSLDKEERSLDTSRSDAQNI
jgi:Co/Zn/Cd efflux system component